MAMPLTSTAAVRRAYRSIGRVLDAPSITTMAILSNRTRTSTFYASGRYLSSKPSRRKDDTDQPWWSLTSLHKRVATILATSLPDTSRQALQQSISESLDDSRTPKSHSINEAIVSAQAREASLQHQSTVEKNSANDSLPSDWIERQKQIEKEVEKRTLEKAQERMKLELMAIKEQWKRKEGERRKKEEEERQREVAFSKWQENVDRERQREGGATTTRNEITIDDDQISKNRESSINTTKLTHHPILGRQVAHLPYKRIHLTSASTLASLPVYEKQRAYRHDRAQVMAKDKKKTLWMGIPGVISLMEEDDGRLSILDGQHRVGMMALLEEEQRKIESKGNQIDNSDESLDELATLDLQNILVEVFPHRPRDDTANHTNQKQSEQDDKATIFTEINKAEPIKLLDLPGIANKRTRDIIDHAASHFHNAYPAMFSVSQKCRAPHLNLDNLRDALFASDVIKREKIGSGGELAKWMMKKNDELKEIFEENDGKEVGRSLIQPSDLPSSGALKKARKFDFYLGLESTWLYK